MKCGQRPSCPPPVETRLPYDELSHEVDRNVLSVRVAKKVGRIEPVGALAAKPASGPTLSAECEDSQGKKCKPGCAKVNVIPNEAPPPKQPDEEMFLLRASRQMIPYSDEMRNVLELELRTPRNYEPLATKLASQTLCTDATSKKSTEPEAGSGERAAKKKKSKKK
ncbi:hypothetical protein QAD02_014819 [Eretmocerus hayati]|uniref:Uncharacterized protein n=1 Tax=Eretmocerus hayati TaxID=131215 RepID=A0ACC2P9B0_9HYME|nr:hypothetical protein QAD02_014819 [Eretmocerus hayati]